jgi:hypothetical protein
MGMRRFTRLTNAFSKEIENHCAADALYVAHYNMVRVHRPLRGTPAVAAGVETSVRASMNCSRLPRSGRREPGEDGATSQTVWGVEGVHVLSAPHGRRARSDRGGGGASGREGVGVGAASTACSSERASLTD